MRKPPPDPLHEPFKSPTNIWRMRVNDITYVGFNLDGDELLLYRCGGRIYVHTLAPDCWQCYTPEGRQRHLVKGRPRGVIVDNRFWFDQVCVSDPERLSLLLACNFMGLPMLLDAGE